MSSASGEKVTEERCLMDGADDDDDDAAATTSCSNQHEGLCCDAQRAEVENDREGEESGGGGGGEERTLSSASSDSSVAVNCRSYPTEVVVHGRKVQKVRVLFAPFPPMMSSGSGQMSMSGHPVRRRGESLDRRRRLTSSDPMGHGYRRYRHSGSTVAQATDDLGGTVLPMSQEVSSGCFIEGMPSVGEQTPDGGCVPPVDQRESGDLRGGVEVKMRLEIQNGISFIEDRLVGLIRLNQRLRTDLETEMRNSEILRGKVTMTEARLEMAETRLERTEAENGELKQQLDGKEKDVMRMGEEMKEEWNRRIRLEESLMELKRDKDLELKSLKDQLNARNAEVRTLEVELKHRKQLEEKDESRAETVELVARAGQLEETLRRLQREKEKVDEVATHLEKDVEAWKVKYETGRHDLEVQMGRFQALKKCYGDLQEENQRLAKTTQRVLRDPVGSGDSIRIIDLPEQTRSGGSLQGQGQGQGQHSGHTSVTPNGGNKMTGARDNIMRLAARHRKKSQESAGSDHSFSLPPVQKFCK